ncbi:MAG: hypothetical protein FD123_3933, partial [Bacteroidetes bacterium]
FCRHVEGGERGPGGESPDYKKARFSKKPGLIGGIRNLHFYNNKFRTPVGLVFGFAAG